MEGLVVKLVESEDERRAAYAVRVRVFVHEQGVPYEEELDVEDKRATHAIAILDEKGVGTGRLVRDGAGEARIGRMAVDADWRGRGIGGRILEALEEAARGLGMAEAVLHAQTYVRGFYAGHGYVEEGEVFREVGIEHVRMRKRL